MPKAGRDEKGSFVQGNQIWKMRKNNGGNTPKFGNPEDLEAKCLEYFQWVEDNPLKEAELVKFQGEAKEAHKPKLRAMSINALCLYIGIVERTWYLWKDTESELHRPDLIQVMQWAEGVIRAQKFEGAAADLLNANIIARDLGMADKQEHSGPNGGPIKTEDTSRKEIARRLAFLLSSGAKSEE